MHWCERSLAGDVDPSIWQQKWTVHVKAIGTGEHAALYLSRYVYHVALTNHRIERFEPGEPGTQGRVTFRYQHARTGETRRVTLPVDAFIARFLQHVLPRGFTKIRSYGLLSPTRRPDLDRTRYLLQLHSDSRVAQSDETTAKPSDEIPHTDAISAELRCPMCQRGHLQFVERYPRSRAPPL